MFGEFVESLLFSKVIVQTFSDRHVLTARVARLVHPVRTTILVETSLRATTEWPLGGIQFERFERHSLTVK